MTTLIAIVLATPLCAFGTEETKSQIDHTGFTPISDRAGLEAIAADPQGKYVLTRHIDLSDAPWSPIPFSGVLDGNGYAIYNVTIVEPAQTPIKTVDGNHKEYDTLFAAFFSRADGAQIDNLTMLNVKVDITAKTHCFASCLIGYAQDVRLNQVYVKGRVSLRTQGIMGGVAGMIGYGYGVLEAPVADVTLVYIDDEQRTDKSESFLGGVTACGYTSIQRGNITLDGYASVRGYAHNGGIIGMAHYPGDRKDQQKCYLRYNTVNVSIRFFEINDDRRAYCRQEIGENLHELFSIYKTTRKRFKSIEYKKDRSILTPEKCETPDYHKTVTAPTQKDFGYTTYTCAGCQYAYTDDYVAPLE